MPGASAAINHGLLLGDLSPNSKAKIGRFANYGKIGHLHLSGN
jgi:hypothetical protein